MRLHAYAPTRIDLAGGTLDLWPLYLFHPGALTVNLAITRYAHCELESRRDRRIVLVSRDHEQREEFPSRMALEKASQWKIPLLAELVRYFAPREGFTLTTWSEAPAGSGLGGSSALAVAVIAALSRYARARAPASDWVPLARDIEVRLLGVPTGEQDHYPAVYGGASAIHLEPLRTWREELPADFAALEERLVLVYTGRPRGSGVNNWEVYKKYLDGDRRLKRNLAEISETAVRMRGAFLKQDWDEAGRLLAREWEVRRRNTPTISTELMDRLAHTGQRRGALGAKACGAGGGGCMVFLAAEGRREELAKALEAAGAERLAFRLARKGIQIESAR